MEEQFSNNATTFLDEPLFIGQDELTVVNALDFPTTPQFRLLIDNEYLIVTAIDGNTFTVLRGQEGTDEADHEDLATVLHVLTAGALYNLTQTPSPPAAMFVPLSNGDPDEPYLVFDSLGQCIMLELPI